MHSPTDSAEPPAAIDSAGDDEQAARKAWQVEISRHGPAVERALRRRGASPERARDIAQDTWVKLFVRQREGQLPSGMKLPQLAIRQAEFLWAEDCRRQARRHHLSAAQPGVLAAMAQGDSSGHAHDTALGHATMHGLERVIDARRKVAQIEDVLRTAHPTTRAVFELRYGPGKHTTRDIAERVGVSEQRVRQIICEVRKRLQVALAELEPANLRTAAPGPNSRRPPR